MSEEIQQAPAQEQPESTPTQLQISDLLVCVQAIQLASQRGAFRAEEFTHIGGTFDRITAFLKENGLVKTAGEQTAEQTAAE